MMKLSFSNTNTALYNIYFFCLFGLMPMLVTPWRNELYYDGKMIFIMGFTLLFVAFAIVRGQCKFRRISIVEGCLISFAFLAVLSTFFSVDQQISLWGQPRSREGLFVIIMYLVIFYIFYRFYFFSSFILEAVLLCAILVSSYGVLMHYNLLPPASNFAQGAWEQGLSTIGNRNFAGAYCTLFFPISIGFWL